MTALKELCVSVCTAAATWSYMGAAAAAQTAPATSEALDSRTAEVAFRIEAQPIYGALREFASQAHLQLIYETAEVSSSIRSQNVAGEFTPEAALRRLLAHTNLDYKIINNRTVSIRPSGAALTHSGRNEPAGGGSHAEYVAAAPTPTEDAGGAAEALASDRGLAEIVVTSQKREERLLNVPISISVIGGQDLNRSTFKSVTEVLNTVPGVVATVSPQGGGTQLTIRGVSAPYALFSGSSPIAYYVDAVPFGLVRSAVAPDENVYDLQQIEVLRGPQGTLYGANALNGVVRVLTSDPDLNSFDFRARSVLSTTDSGGQNYGGDMVANIPIVAGKLGARVVVGDQHLTGWLDSPIATHANSGDASNVRLKVSAMPTDSLEVGLSAWHSQARFDAPNNADQTGRIAAIRPEPSSTTNNAYALKVNYDLSSFSVSSVSSYFVYRNEAVVDLFPVNGFQATIPQSLRSRVASEEMNLTSKLDGPWRWSAGVFYRDAKDTTLQYLILYPSLTNILDDDFSDTSRSWATYGELGRRFFENKLEFSVGLRYFHDDSSTKANSPLPGQDISLLPIKAVSKATTPRAVLTWHPGEDTMVYASYGQGFRSGFPQDELVPPSFAPVKPDKLSNYEIGTKGTLWDHHLSYDAAAYYIQWRGVQQVIGIPGGNGTVNAVTVNGKSASGPGVEFSVSARLLQNFDLGVNFSWNDLKFDDAVFSAGQVLFSKGARLGASPEYTAGASAKYSFPLGGSGIKGIFSASANYTSEMNSVVVGFGNFQGQSILTAKSDFTVEWPEHWRAMVYVDNLSNVQRTPLIVLPVWREQLRPRTLGAQVEYSFK